MPGGFGGGDDDDEDEEDDGNPFGNKKGEQFYTGGEKR